MPSESKMLLSRIKAAFFTGKYAKFDDKSEGIDGEIPELALFILILLLILILFPKSREEWAIDRMSEA